MEELIRTPLTVVHVLACAFLILVVLLQPGKSGGLGLFATPAATQVFGGRGAGTILTKITWVTTATFFVSSISLAYLSTSSDESLQERAAASEEATLDKVEKKTESKSEPAPPEQPAPVEPAPVEPAPVEPAPVEPAPVKPVPARPTPAQPATPSESEPPPPAQPAPDQPGAPADSE